MVVCTPVVTQVDKIHICGWVATIKVKERWNHGYSSEIVHTGIWWGKPVRVKCVQTGGVIRGCGSAAYVIQACPKEAVVVWTLTKVIRLDGTVLAWEEQLLSSHNISRITHLFSPKILHLNQRHLFRCVTHWYCHNQLNILLLLTVFWVTWTFSRTGLGPFWGHHVKTIRAMNYPSCRETFLHVRKFAHLWHIASDQYNLEINEIMPCKRHFY